MSQSEHAEETGETDNEGEDSITYQFEMRREDWREWTESIPRSVALSDRLRTIITADAKVRQRDGYNEMEERTARLLATRIRHRGRTALQALERGDTEKVREEIKQMREIAELFDE